MSDIIFQARVVDKTGTLLFVIMGVAKRIFASWVGVWRYIEGRFNAEK